MTDTAIEKNEKKVQALQTVDEARTAIFSGEKSKAKKLPATLNGVKLTLVQPSVQQFMDMQTDDNGSNLAVRFLIDYAYLEGTTTKLFTPEDYDSLCALPMNAEVIDIMSKANELLDINVEKKLKN